MKVVISGNGRMGKMVAEVCEQQHYQIVATLDTTDDWKQLVNISLENTVVIDFSMPSVAVDNLFRCFDLKVPVVTGTTGWYDRLNEVIKKCVEKEGTLFYAPNFSLGVNVFFHANKQLAKVMSKVDGYRCSLSETHHIHKLDAPSGTALKVAEDILDIHPMLSVWRNHPTDKKNELPVISVREGEVPGTHEVFYESDYDVLTLKHEAKTRRGFAVGAVLAAEFIIDQKGVFTMEDYLKKLGV